MGLASLGWQNIQVLDRLPAPQPSGAQSWGSTDKSYNIGVSETGQVLLEELGVMPRVHACSTPLLWRKEWTPQSPDGRWVQQERYNRTRDTVVRFWLLCRTVLGLLSASKLLASCARMLVWTHCAA